MLIHVYIKTLNATPSQTKSTMTHLMTQCDRLSLGDDGWLKNCYTTSTHYWHILSFECFSKKTDTRGDKPQVEQRNY